MFNNVRHQKSNILNIHTLQPSQVIAPKWNPDDCAPQTRHGIIEISLAGHTAAPKIRKNCYNLVGKMSARTSFGMTAQST